MNAYEKSLALGLSGTPAEQVAILRTLTRGDILGTKLGKWLGERGLLTFDGTNWYGTLQGLIDAGQITGDNLAGIRELKAVLAGTRGDGLATTDPAWSPIVFATISAIAQVSPDAAALIDSFYALDGGRPYKDLTVDQFGTQKSEYEWAGLKQVALQRCTQAYETAKAEYRKAESTPQTIILANRDALEG